MKAESRLPGVHAMRRFFVFRAEANFSHHKVDVCRRLDCSARIVTLSSRSQQIKQRETDRHLPRRASPVSKTLPHGLL